MKKRTTPLTGSKRRKRPTGSKPRFAPKKVTRCQGIHCGGLNPETSPHPCPYAEEIHGDSTTLCTCCADCAHECAMDI